MSETGAGMGGAARGLGGRPPRGGADATAAAGQAVGLVSRPAGPLRGELRVTGDKSISHRALLIGALALGETRIRGLLEADDVLSTAQALSALGAAVRSDGEGLWRVAGRGVGGLGEPERVLYMGNSGTGARLLMGVVASHPFAATFTGDASLVTRPHHSRFSSYQRTVSAMPSSQRCAGAHPSSLVIRLLSSAYRRSCPSRSVTRVISDSGWPNCRNMLVMTSRLFFCSPALT